MVTRAGLGGAIGRVQPSTTPNQDESESFDMATLILQHFIIAVVVFSGCVTANAVPPNHNPPEKVHVIGGCVEDAQKVVSLFAAQEFGPTTLYLICNQSEWNKVRRTFDKPASTLAFTILKSRTTVIGPAPLSDPLLLHTTVAHEAKHLACSCTMGELF